jgi:hypothetical protein
VRGYCERSNEPSFSLKFIEFRDWMRELLASEEGLCSIVSWLVD